MTTAGGLGLGLGMGMAPQGVGSGSMMETSRRGWIAPSVLLGAFFLLLWQVLSHGVVTRVDRHVRDGIQRAAHTSGLHWLAPIGRGCADLGDQFPALLCLIVVTACVAWRHRSWRPVLLAGAALAVLASVVPLKLWIGRAGPGEAVLGNADLGFFPSGHTADALCCYGMSAFLLGSFIWRERTARLAVGGAAALLLLLTIFGLLWSNYHWLSDVIGSFCWCGGWLLVIARLFAESGPRREVSAEDASAGNATARL
jgi:undecaprenyl-diphosphatase